MAHRYVWVLTRHDGIDIDAVLAHCGSEDNESRDDESEYCCVCAAGAPCDWHPPEMSGDEWDEWLSENAFVAGCPNHLSWDYATVGGNAHGAITQSRGPDPSAKRTLPASDGIRGPNSVRLSDLDVDRIACVPFHIVNGAVRLEQDISALRLPAIAANYAADQHRPQVKDYLAAIPNPADVIVWGVDAHV